MKVAVLSGKGGAGKTFLACGLACAAGRATYVDCDVEEPNGRLFLRPENPVSAPVTRALPVFDAAKCTGCRKGVERCRFNALVLVKGAPLVFPEVCHSCGVCAWVCPEGAVGETRRELGRVETGESGGVRVVTGELEPGEATGTPVIAAALAEAGDAGYDELVRAFGTPEDAAAELQESVNEAEAAASRSKSRRIAISLGIVAVVLVVTLALFFLRINERTVTIVDRNVAEGTPIISAEETK